MYTQCPDCSTAFRVTAEVLKQAAGKVRCGGCGNAFNALAHLSEEKPLQQAAAPAPEPNLPELTPEPLEADTPPAAARPEAMSPEQSAALLKTLDSLAGDDVRLEDTGIEWRVLDDEDEERSGDVAPPATLLDEDLTADLESRKVDEVLTSMATPVDEVLDAGGTAVDSPEVFEEAARTTVPDNELRFDDNTGLPEDEEFDDEPLVAATPVVPEPVRDAPEAMANIQVDLGFGDPNEWQDLLEEVGPGGDGDTTTGSIIAPEAPADPEPTMADELEALEIELEEANHDEEATDGDQLASQMEALSLELSGIQEELDMLAGDTGEQTIIDELEALELVEDEEEADHEPADETGVEDEAEAEVENEARVEDEVDVEVEVDEAETEVEAEAESIAETERATEEEEDTSIDDDLIAAAFEAEARDSVDVSGEASGEKSGEHEVPPMSEEEQTLNMLIDQDLMALAVEDQDGFASTMVLGEAAEEPGDADDEAGAITAPDMPGIPKLPVDAEVEEIVMEGAIAHSGDIEEKAAEEAALKEEAAALIAAATASEEETKQPVNRGLVAGIVVLVILLALQAVHFSRNALARSPAVYEILAPIYQALGVPLTPAWDITGWDFEATRGSTDESGKVLSIFSRIGNNSESALPYPVISVSLTDRFEETIGSRVFEPAEYLSDDLDPRQTVAPGATFNALMLIESPADAATGFKLNVCYRLADRNLRCAIKDFR